MAAIKDLSLAGVAKRAGGAVTLQRQIIADDDLNPGGISKINTGLRRVELLPA